MKNKFFLTSLMICISVYVFGQVPEEKEEYMLLHSGRVKVEIRNNGQLEDVWYIDSARKVIIKYALVPATSNQMAPSYDSAYHIHHTLTKFYSKSGRSDSSLSVSYIQRTLPDGKPIYMVDSTLSINNYALSRNEFYVIKGGKAKLQQKDAFTYNNKGQLISSTQTFGQVTRIYTYNEKNQLVKEVIGGKLTYTYTYDTAGRLLTRKGPTVGFSYEYDDHSLLKKKTQKTKGLTQVWEYTYE